MNDREFAQLTLWGRGLRRSYIIGGALVALLSGAGSAAGVVASVHDLRRADSVQAVQFQQHVAAEEAERQRIMTVVQSNSAVARAMSIRMCLVDPPDLVAYAGIQCDSLIPRQLQNRLRAQIQEQR